MFNFFFNEISTIVIFKKKLLSGLYPLFVTCTVYWSTSTTHDFYIPPLPTHTIRVHDLYKIPLIYIIHNDKIIAS